MTCKLPTNKSLLEGAPERLKLIGLIGVHCAHLDRMLWRLLSLIGDLDLPAARAMLPAPTSNPLRGKVLAKAARAGRLSPESMSRLEACLANVERCTEHRDELINRGYGIGRDGLVISAVADECGEIVPVTREQLQRLAVEFAECTVELNNFLSTVGLDDERRQYRRTKDVAGFGAAP